MGVVICLIIYCIEQLTLPMVYHVYSNDDPRMRQEKKRYETHRNTNYYINFHLFHRYLFNQNTNISEVNDFLLCQLLDFVVVVVGFSVRSSFRKLLKNNFTKCL